MKFSAPLTILALAAVASASDVLDLTKDAFQKEVAGDGLTLVEFFAPWCGHCKALAPHYEEAATELKSKNIKLAKVDCTVEAELCQDFGIQGYPTLKVFSSGVPSDYTGPRKADGIIAYMTKQSLPAVSEVTAANHDEFKGADKVVLIAYTPPGSEPHKAFNVFANSHRDSYLFGSTSDPKAFSLAGLSPSEPSIVLYKSFDEGKNVLPTEIFSALTAESLGSWIKVNAIPLLAEISPENFASYSEAGIPLAYTFVDPEQKDANDKLIKTLEPIAAEYKGKLSFVWIDAVKFIDHAKSLNLNVESWPGFVIQDLAAQTKYPLKSSGSVKWDASTVKEFVKSFTAGDIKPDVKSAAIPTVQEESVWDLVSDEYEKVVWEDGFEKDVFVEFYAPWCGHCKRLKPIWDTLGDKYADIPSVLIAKFDATENDIPPTEPFKVTGFPTIKFKPAGSDQFIDYSGDRSLESLIEFVEENAVSDLSPPNKKNETEKESLLEKAEAVAEEVKRAVVGGGEETEEKSPHDEL